MPEFNAEHAFQPLTTDEFLEAHQKRLAVEELEPFEAFHHNLGLYARMVDERNTRSLGMFSAAVVDLEHVRPGSLAVVSIRPILCSGAVDTAITPPKIHFETPRNAWRPVSMLAMYVLTYRRLPIAGDTQYKLTGGFLTYND